MFLFGLVRVIEEILIASPVRLFSDGFCWHRYYVVLLSLFGISTNKTSPIGTSY